MVCLTIRWWVCPWPGRRRNILPKSSWMRCQWTRNPYFQSFYTSRSGWISLSIEVVSILTRGNRYIYEIHPSIACHSVSFSLSSYLPRPVGRVGMACVRSGLNRSRNLGWSYSWKQKVSCTGSVSELCCYAKMGSFLPLSITYHMLLTSNNLWAHLTAIKEWW